MNLFDRRSELLRDISKDMSGLEIGPFCLPLVPKREGYNVLTLDVFTAEQLRETARANPELAQWADNIETVDLLGPAQDVADIVRRELGDRKFDYIISSHNLEHIPDPIRFLQGCREVLRPDGIISLAIPDHRCCFDYYRPASTAADWIEAFLSHADRPTPKQVFLSNYMRAELRTPNGGIGSFCIDTDPASVHPVPVNVSALFERWKAPAKDQRYVDAHCWAMTPATFELLALDLAKIGLFPFQVDRIIGPNGNEFYVRLRGREPSLEGYEKSRAALLRQIASESRPAQTVDDKTAAMMSKRPGEITIAAVVPLYNGADHVEEALQSILAQTRPAEEIIVVDDGSTDGGRGAEIVRRLALDHPKIILFTKENGGQGSARNFGIRRSKSTHIALLDQDDVWYPHHLAALEKPLRKPSPYPVGWSYANLDQIDADGTMVVHNVLDILNRNHPKKTIAECLREDMFILPGASLIDRTAFEKVGGFDERLAGYEDDDLFLRLFLAGYRSIYINKPLTKWRIHADSTSFGIRMAKSRAIFFDTLVSKFPPDHRLNRFYLRDFVVPRFTPVVLSDMARAAMTGDSERKNVAIDHLRRMMPFMPPRTRTRLKILIRLLSVELVGRTVSVMPPALRGRAFRVLFA